MKRFNEQTLQKQQRELAEHYAHHLHDMSNMVIVGLETEEHKKIDMPKAVEIIANNEGYAKTNVLGNAIQGKSLNFTINNLSYPIGYNIFIPNGVEKVNKVVVSAYGGFTREDATLVSTPDSPYRLARHLLNAGCVFIDLNLPDFLQNEFQSKMNDTLQNIVHSGIDAFFKTISQTPSSLSKSLVQKGFENADFYLMGASFGGRTAIRHGQLFPSTFKGYISHDGAIAHADYRGEINPYRYIKDSQEPVLILQNCDDNNVRMTEAIRFYQEMIGQGKQDLARLCFFEKGSPIPETEDKWNKGHFYPERELTRYINTIISFVHDGPAAIPEINKYHLLKQKNLSSRFFAKHHVKEYFLALATQKYDENPEHAALFLKDKDWEMLWEKEYAPMFQVIYEVRMLEKAQDYYEETIQRLIKQNLLTDEVVSNAIKHHSAIYREYYKETSQFKEVSLEDIYNNPYIIEEFRKRLLNPDRLKIFLLESLFFGNPALLPKILPSMIMKARLGQSLECKKLFEASVKESKANMQDIWRAVVSKVIEKQKQQRQSFTDKPSKESLLAPSSLYEQLFLMDADFIGNALESKIAYDAKQEYLLKAVNEIANEQLSSLNLGESYSEEAVEIINIAKQILNSTDYELTDDDLNKMAHFVNASKVDIQNAQMQELAKISYHVSLIDKARKTLEPNNLIKGIKRQLLIQQFLDDDKVEYQARKAFIQSVQELFPKLSQSAILSLIKQVNLDEINKSSVQTAIKDGNTALASALVQMGVLVQSEDSVLESACRSDDVSLIGMLINKGAQVTPKCFENAMEGKSDIIQLLMHQAQFPYSIENNKILANPLYARWIFRALTEQDNVLKEIVEEIALKNDCEEALNEIEQITMKLIRGELNEPEIIEGIKAGKIAITFKDENGQNLMMMAAKNNYESLMRFLLEQGVDPSIKDNHGHSALIHALYNGNINLAKSLIEIPSKLAWSDEDKIFVNDYIKILSRHSSLDKYSTQNFVTPYYDNPMQKVDKHKFAELLQSAVKLENMPVVVDMLTCALGINIRTKPDEQGMPRGEPILSKAVSNKAFGFAIACIKAGFNPNESDETNNAFLASAIENHQEALMEALFQARANPNAKNRRLKPCISLAIDNGDSHLIFKLLELGADVNGVNEDNEPFLIEAISHHLPEVALAFISRGANVNATDRFGNDALRKSIERGYVEVTRALLEKGAQVDNPDWKNSTPLIEACRHIQSMDIIVELIKHNANVNARDNNGCTPLGLVLKYCKSEKEKELAHLLIDKGADLKALDSDSDSPLWLAINSGDYSLMDKIIQRGGDVDAVNNNRRARSRSLTPLEWALSTGDAELALFLIEHGAKVNVNYHFGETPLSVAAKLGNKEIVLKLIEYGAVVDSENEIGNTALANALQNGHEAVALALIDAGANSAHTNKIPLPILSLATEKLQRTILEHVESTKVQPSRQKPITLSLKEQNQKLRQSSADTAEVLQPEIESRNKKSSPDIQ